MKQRIATSNGLLKKANGETSYYETELLIDVRELLHKLGPKAANSKGGVTRLAGGLIVIKATHK